MEISKKGKRYLERCNRITLIRVVSDYKVSKLITDDQFSYDLADAVAYFITSVSDDKQDAAMYVNEFLQHLISNVNDFVNDPSKWINYSEQKCSEF